MAKFPDHMDAIEKRICNKLISAILHHGWAVRVHDGEEWASPDWTTNRGDIQKDTAATDMTIYAMGELDVHTGKYSWVGQIDLVHGNYEDLISDYRSLSPAFCGMIEAITAAAE